MSLNFNNPFIVLGVIFLVTLLVVVAMFLIVPIFVKRGYPISKWLQTAQEAMKRIETILYIVGKPDKNGKVNGNIKMLEFLVQMCSEAVSVTQQLYRTSKLTSDEERKKYAMEYVRRALATADIQLTPDMEKLIDDTIESSVYHLKHSVDNTKNNLVGTSPGYYNIGC
jgi:hypothetical protein